MNSIELSESDSDEEDGGVQVGSLLTGLLFLFIRFPLQCSSNHPFQLRGHPGKALSPDSSESFYVLGRAPVHVLIPTCNPFKVMASSLCTGIATASLLCRIPCTQYRYIRKKFSCVIAVASRRIFLGWKEELRPSHSCSYALDSKYHV